MESDLGEEMQPMNEASNEASNEATNEVKSNEDNDTTGKCICIWKVTAISFVVSTAILMIILITVAMRSQTCTKFGLEAHFNLCPSPHTDKIINHRANDLYSGLSAEETDQVWQFMAAQEELHIIRSVDADLNTNYIYSIEDYLPDKKDAMDWLDGISDQAPIRKARVIVFMGRDKTVKDYLVYPIPNPTAFEEAFINRKGNKALTWESRPVCNVVEMPLITRFILDELAPLRTLLNESFQAFVDESCDENLSCMYFNSAVRSKLGSTDRHILTWFFVGYDRIEDYYVYPINLYIAISTPNNMDQFVLQRIYYNGVEYRSVSELLSMYNENISVRFQMPDLDIDRGFYGSPQHVPSPNRNLSGKRPPKQFYPDGQRFTVNGRHIEYLGWSFDYHTRTISGLQLLNIRYEGEQIAYEVALTDIAVFYSGAPPDDYFKNYFDNGWATGRYNMPLIHGVDCPDHAVYLDSHVYGVSIDMAVTMKDAICIFEHSNSIPLRRHFSTDFYEWGYRYAFSMPDSVLIVRQILTIWNYDYILDYEFHQNGVVELKVSSTGYVAVTTNIKKGETKLGQVVNTNWNTVANLHQHLFNYKVDLDVAGQSNRFQTINLQTETIAKNEWANRDWYQMIMEKQLILDEQSAALRYNFDTPKYYVIFNEKEKLDGQNRAYRIYTSGFSKMVLPEDSPLLKGGSWMKYQLAVSKHNENERTTTSHFVQGSPDVPAVNFEDFISNNDNLVDEDLVAWVTIGLHHAPTFEDLPVTTTPGKTLSIALIPFNFFARDPSIHSKDAVVFWNRNVIDHPDDVTDMNGTCIPSSKNPYIRV